MNGECYVRLGRSTVESSFSSIGTLEKGHYLIGVFSAPTPLKGSLWDCVWGWRGGD